MINLNVPQQPEPGLKPCISVVGVGGAGGNAVNNMIADSLQGVDFIVANTDAQALSLASTDRRIQLGQVTTQGLGAGAKPEVGRAAAEETFEQIAEQINGANMVFITAGMGGGTGTGAAPVIARVAREMGILTVGVVTKPFQFEGQHRMRLAETGIEELSQYVDTLIIIPNQNLFRVANEKTTFADAFKMADDVLNAGVRSITDLMIMPGLINLDFADVRTVMSDMGRAMMGTGEASGERRALDAAEAAIANPLLEDTCMKGAGGVLINITGGPDITLFEVDEAANRIRDEVEGEAHIIFGSCFDPELEGKMRVSVVATGISGAAAMMPRPQQTTTTNAVSAAPAAAGPAPAPQAVAQRPQMRTMAPTSAPVADGQPAQAEPAAHIQPEPVHEDLRDEVQEEHRATGTDGLAPPQPTMFDPPRTATPPQPEQRYAEPPRQGSLDMGLPQPREGQFIPRPPVDRGTPLGDMPQRPSLFAGQQQAPKPALAASQPDDARDRPRPEARSTGFFKGLAAKLAGEPQAETRSEPPRAHQPARQEPQADPAPQARDPEPRHQPAPQHAEPARHDGLSASQEDRPAPTRQGADEDELEIPAFLRRQAN